MKRDQIYAIFQRRGFVVVKQLFSQEWVDRILLDINMVDDCDTYYDNANLVRRKERLYNKGNNLLSLNQKLLSLLSENFSDQFTLFKDKYNSKPPGGEGFFAHYDGIFTWQDNNGKVRQGWYEYAPEFVNALVALDPSNMKNGTIEIADRHNLDFQSCLKNTRKNGTPQLSHEVEEATEFEVINLDAGDVVLFSHQCPHRSAINNSERARRIIYYTYHSSRYGDNYSQYFLDKKTSNKDSNVNKALSADAE